MTTTSLLSLVGCLTVWAATPEVSEPLVVEGLLRLIEHVEVPARSEGRLEKLHVREGSLVTRGEVLGKLDDKQPRLMLRKAETELQLAQEKAHSEAAVKIARLTRDLSLAEFDRVQYAKKAAPASVSASEFDRVRMEAEKSGLELTRLTEERRFAYFMAQSKAVEMELAQAAIEERSIVSPLDGMVVQVHRHEGEWLRPGEKTIRVVRLDRLRVEAFVSADLPLPMLQAAAVRFLPADPVRKPGEFSGEIVFVNPEADPVNGQIRVWAEIDNRERQLRPGQRGELVIVLNAAGPPAEAQEATSIPATKQR